jgi:aryl-alcohol dehydrogenase-like predicted oxidoreductase
MTKCTRREFFEQATGAVAGVGLAGVALAGAETAKPKIPLRELGKTGVRVSMLGLGGGSRFLNAVRSVGAEAVLTRAFEGGITYFDTASIYGPNRDSEKAFGSVLPALRSRIFLSTKVSGDRSYDATLRSVEESLKLLKTGSLDLLQIHDVTSADDLATWDKPAGVYTALRKLKDQRVTRFIGFSGHQAAEVHKRVIETFDFDTVLMPINAAQARVKDDSFPGLAFRQLALPAAAAKGMGIIAMKTTRDLVGEGPSAAPVARLLAYAWDQPIATAIVGMDTLQMLDENLALAASYQPGATETRTTAERLSRNLVAGQLGWTAADHRDGTA